MRQYSLFDQIILRFDTFLNENSGIKLTKPKVPVPPPSERPATEITVDPNAPASTTSLTAEEQKHSAALMRINHSGEVSAQALYLGQAWTARDPELTKMLSQAAEEEKLHLEWCKHRIQSLGGRTSYLNPLWAAGSFGIGALAGFFGDKWSLGFLAETEHQVTAHLQKHLNQLSPQDNESRAILEKMQADEMQHANHAIALGGVCLPKSVQLSMKFVSKIMTFSARYI